jgi:hypothetical protein
MLIAVESAKSGHSTRANFAVEAPHRAAPWFVVGRWWKSFRLVLLLAIGPALLALALATAHKAPQYEPQFTTNSAGAQVVTSYVLLKADIPSNSEVRLGQRLMIAAVLVVTILCHGGAAISIGLALAIANEWSRRAVVAAVGFVLLLTFVLPVYLFVLNNGRALDTFGWSFVMAADSLLAVLVSRTSLRVGEALSSVIFWDVLVALLAVGLSGWTNWVERSRLIGIAKPSLATDLDDAQPGVETAFVVESAHH